MTLTIGHFGQDKIHNDNPFYAPRSRRESLEDLKNVWLEKLSKNAEPHYKAEKVDIKRNKKFGGVVSLSETVLPKRKSYPDLKFFIYEDENTLSPKFQEIIEEIESSQEILKFEEGWDGYNAPKIPVEIYNKAILFLRKYANFIYNSTDIIIDSPEINAGINKNVFLSWRTENARLAISFEYNSRGEIMAHYYGDLNNNQEPIKGNVPTSDVKDHLAYWMKNLI